MKTKIKVVYQMSAYIEADTLEECKNIWNDAPLNQEGHFLTGSHDGWMCTEYDNLIEVYKQDTFEEIITKDW